MYERIKSWIVTPFSLLGTAFLLGFSLLPLSCLLLAYPAFYSQESVLTDTVSDHRSWLSRQLARLFAIIGSLTVVLTLFAVSIEVVTRLPLPAKGSFSVIAETFLPAPSIVLGQTPKQREEALAMMPSELQEFFKTPLHKKLPPAAVQHWPFVILLVYLLDVIVLTTIGKVPLAYNLRNLRVRWLTNAMTAISFVFVIGLLAFLLAFVNGMNNLTENTGVPGNVFVLSDGATDEILSNLGYGDLDNVERAVVNEEQVLNANDEPVLTEDGKEVWRPCPPLRIKSMIIDGKPRFIASRETYYSINQPVPNSDPPRRRFVQLRTHDDATLASEVHNIQLYPGGRWFSDVGVDNGRIECVLGEGIARTLGADFGKPSLEVGDEFPLGQDTWLVTGIMKSEGTTFGSEIWAKRMSLIYKPFGKEKYTTLVMRTEADTREAARKFANYLSKRYDQQKLKAFAEPDYYAELTKTNNVFLTAIIVIAVVIAVGGVFAMMTTMFASIAQRRKDIGVLRLLGFKRWQVTVSFLLESLALAVIGGVLGCLVAWIFADGKETTSNLSGGGGGPGGKSIALKIDVDFQVMAMAMCFAMVMGRLGGLVPAMSAMKVKILDSLR